MSAVIASALLGSAALASILVTHRWNMLEVRASLPVPQQLHIRLNHIQGLRHSAAHIWLSGLSLIVFALYV